MNNTRNSSIGTVEAWWRLGTRLGIAQAFYGIINNGSIRCTGPFLDMSAPEQRRELSN